ncbi:MAG: hypothetical protein NXH85_11380 [Pseudomonadaceae bacterium]|nr:hypothetical protein [Pseudomonadaceae bacterium]
MTEKKQGVDEASEEELPAHQPDQWKIWLIAFVVLGTTLALALLI